MIQPIGLTPRAAVHLYRDRTANAHKELFVAPVSMLAPRNAFAKAHQIKGSQWLKGQVVIKLGETKIASLVVPEDRDLYKSEPCSLGHS
jgi:hypothetical protein